MLLVSSVIARITRLGNQRSFHHRAHQACDILAGVPLPIYQYTRNWKNIADRPSALLGHSHSNNNR